MDYRVVGFLGWVVKINGTRVSCLEIAHYVGKGNSVTTLSKANRNDEKLNQDYAQVDIFRIENGKVVEHWDNVEPLPEENVNSGKF